MSDYYIQIYILMINKTNFFQFKQILCANLKSCKVRISGKINLIFS